MKRRIVMNRAQSEVAGSQTNALTANDESRFFIRVPTLVLVKDRQQVV